MHRSMLCILQRQKNIRCALKIIENAWCTSQAAPNPQSSIAINKSFHGSVRCRSDEDDTANEDKIAKVSKIKKRNILRKEAEEEEKLHSAAIEAAKSLPGDWTRTADDLMARLSVQTEKTPEPAGDGEPSTQGSLLSKMKIGRSFERSKRDFGSPLGEGEEGMRFGQNKQIFRKRLARKNEVFTSLYSQQRLGIFDAEKIETNAEGKNEEDKESDLWQIVTKEKMMTMKGSLPRNGFEEMIQWTKDGRMWNFPIDNEEYMDEERQYKFHEHVFLNHHLKAFPSEGPLRRFMDLVVLGLSKNPWISVPEKVEHLQWYTEYFQKKQKLLELAIGEKANMKESS